MKTSNKLIILFVALLYVVPLSAMLIDLRNYENGDSKEDVVAQSKFSDDTKDFEAIQLKAQSSELEVVGGKDINIYVTYVDSETPGIKYNSNMKENLKVTEGADGKVTVSFNENSSIQGFLSLYIYGKNLENINMQNASSLGIEGVFSNLTVTASGLKRLSFSRESTVQQLVIKANEIGDVTLSGAIVSANIDLKNGNLTWDGPSSKNVEFNLNNSNVQVGEDNNSDITFDNLKLTTLGKSEVKFEKVDIKSLSGSLSDSTYINLPTYQLRKLMN